MLDESIVELRHCPKSFDAANATDMHSTVRMFVRPMGHHGRFPGLPNGFVAFYPRFERSSFGVTIFVCVFWFCYGEPAVFFCLFS